MGKRVAIILVDYNGYQDTIECLQSLLQITYSDYQVFIVDNAGNSKHALKRDAFICEHAEVIETGSNLGFAGGNNVGIDYAEKIYHPDYYLLLNNDTIVAPDFLDELMSGYETMENVGLATGKIMMYPQTERIWYGGGEFDEKICRSSMGGFGQNDDGSHDEVRYVKFATGCVLLFSKEFLQSVGKMDDKYFLYCEDTSYCLRTLMAGYNILYWPKAVIMHKEGGSTGRKSPLKQYYLVRNKLMLIKEFGKYKFRSYVRLTWMEFKNVVRGRKRFIDTFRAYMDFFRHKTGKNRVYSKD